MKKIILAAVSFVACSGFAVDPGIAPGSVSLEAGERYWTVTYTLTGMPAVVTVDLQTNTLADASGEWVSIGGENMGFIGGEANKVVYVTNTPAAAYWFPSKACPGRSFAAGSLRAEVTSWPTNTPPDYMVIDLGEGQNLIRWYPSAEALPGGPGNLEYKSTKLVMRKIPAKNVVWLMGSPGKLTDEDNATTNNAPAHKVMLTEDYYIGIYEVTQSQYSNMGGVNVSLYTNEVESPYMPAERIAYNTLRGSGFLWLTKRHQVSSSSPIGIFRARCGIADMDLPTEAQWEYACRAGSGTECHENLEFTQENICKYAVRKANAESATDTYNPDGKKEDYRPSAVGSKMHNGWGLYDMIGNVYELCLDAAGTGNNLEAFHASLAEGWESGAVTEDPVGASNSGNDRIMKRGGSFRDSGDTCRTRVDGSINYAAGLTGKIGYIGFRLCCSVKEAVK